MANTATNGSTKGATASKDQQERHYHRLLDTMMTNPGFGRALKSFALKQGWQGAKSAGTATKAKARKGSTKARTTARTTGGRSSDSLRTGTAG
jgi:hypothetical protein